MAAECHSKCRMLYFPPFLLSFYNLKSLLELFVARATWQLRKIPCFGNDYHPSDKPDIMLSTCELLLNVFFRGLWVWVSTLRGSRMHCHLSEYVLVRPFADRLSISKRQRLHEHVCRKDGRGETVSHTHGWNMRSDRLLSDRAWLIFFPTPKNMFKSIMGVFTFWWLVNLTKEFHAVHSIGGLNTYSKK